MNSHHHSTPADATSATRLTPADGWPRVPSRRRALEEDVALLTCLSREIARAVAAGEEWARPHLAQIEQLRKELEQELGDA